MPRAAEANEIQKTLFPVALDPPSPQTFELGLVLGGTVSTGAYTAGALDVLLEALEKWYGKYNNAPPHQVVLTTAGGSSGGAVCAAILGLLSSRRVPHVSDDPTPQGWPVDTGNPLWDLWVNAFQISRLLTTTDIDPGKDVDADIGGRLHRAQHVPALLNCRMIDEAGAKLAAIGENPDGTERLPYFAAPFRIAVTVTNLRGIQYKIADVPHLPGFSGAADFSGAAYVQHDDFAWFAFPNGRQSGEALPCGKRPDEFWLGTKPAADCVGYDVLVAYATASGAMPLGLAARRLTRPREHYSYRPAARAGMEPGQYPGYFPLPDWGEAADDPSAPYSFSAVDGGTLNNDPFTLVHRAMAGLTGRNEPDRSEATRAIVMIDPLADRPKDIDSIGISLVAVAGSIVDTFKDGARYLTADMDLFADKDVFSRFQLVPFRPGAGKVGAEALAGSSLYAAAGWCARKFRVHDYRLGRMNMERYLRSELVLAGNNKLFENWKDPDRARFALDDDGKPYPAHAALPPREKYYLPIIPCLLDEQPEPSWPVGACNPEELRSPLKTRLNAVVDRVVLDNGEGIAPWLITLFAVPGVVDLVVGKIIDGFKAQLRKAGL